MTVISSQALKYVVCLSLFFCLASKLWAEQFSTGVTKEVIEGVTKGLNYLSENQQKDGSWLCNIGYKLNNDYRVTAKESPHVGVTALACIALMANGSLPNRGRYGLNVQHGLNFVLSCVQENGYISRNGTRMYSHAFATLFLAEIYGMTQRADLKEHLADAVTLIIATQNEEGGWRYQPHSSDADMSITVCQLQALRAARNVGIRVPKEYIERAIRYVEGSAVLPEQDRLFQGAFKYQKMSLGQSRVSFALTAAGVTALHSAGEYYSPIIDRGLHYLLNPPRLDRHPDPYNYFYYYGHYYAAQAMYMAGKDFWSVWFPQVRDELLANQYSDGSWLDMELEREEREPHVGRNFATAMATIILQTPYGYLPIFQR